jgi:hypothetical protein
MSNLSDKDIDRLSREAADSYEPDHSSLSWSRLEQKLIEQIPERPPDGFRFGRINPYIWGMAVILIAGISVFTIKNFNYRQHSTRTNQLVVQGTPSSAKVNNKTNENTIHADSSSRVHVVTSADGKTLIAPTGTIKMEDRGAVPVVISKAISKAESSPVGASKYPSLNTGADRFNKNAGKKGSSSNRKSVAGTAAGFIASDIYNNGIIDNAKKTADNTKPENSDNVVNHQTTSGSNTSLAADGSNNIGKNKRSNAKPGLPPVASSGSALGKVSGNDSLLNLLGRSTTPIPYKSLRVNRSLNFGLAFGPDYTDAGGITNNQLGNNIGLTVGYYLTNKLSVNSGVFYTNKFYWASGHKTGNSNYASGPTMIGNVTTAAAPPPIDFINGSANIWELPLTLRYDFAKNEKTKFFVNAGFSSYFVMKQTYIYFFHNGMRPLAYKIYDDEQINYWFKVADISLGFETEIGKGFSFQAEPFFKLPLKNMGKDNLKLNSYGFLLSFRYSPVLSRTKK